MLVADVDIVRALRQFNSHWDTGQVSELVRRSPHKRRSFEHLRKRLPELPFEVVAGPRQVGKTTLMGHLMADLVERAGVPVERVAYIPVDYPQIELEMEGHLAPVIAAYERFVLKEELGKASDKVYFFLDEIQSLPNWGAELKGLHDAYHPKLRVLATGSSSAALLNAPTADFPGRIERTHIHPLKFGEVVQNAIKATTPIHERARQVRAKLAVAENTPQSRKELAIEIEAFHKQALSHEAAIKRLLDVYIVRGGYPATQLPASDADAFRFFENTLDTIMSKDLKLYEKVRKPGTFRAFLAKLAKEHGGKFVAASYAKDLGVDKETPPVWKTITEELFLVHQLPPLNSSFATIPGRADKAYMQDPGIRAYLSASPRIEELEQSGAVGNIVEGVLFDHLRRLQFNTFGHRSGQIGYWEKPEVDFIAQLPRTVLLVECKYRSSSGSGAARLREAIQKNADALPIVVTRDAFDVNSDIWSIPLWVMLLFA